jgi:hypothetical protein
MSNRWTEEELVVDIILAEFGSGVWLVRGERYIDDLLINNIPRNVTIEIITCESHSDVNHIWLREDGQSGASRSPWAIHPGIVGRIRRSQYGSSIYFSHLSALLDEQAHDIIRAVAVAAADNVEVDVLLVAYIRPDDSRSMTDLTNLRCGVVEDELSRLGVAPSRLVRQVRDPITDPHVKAGGERLDIRVGTD